MNILYEGSFDWLQLYMVEYCDGDGGVDIPLIKLKADCPLDSVLCRFVFLCRGRPQGTCKVLVSRITASTDKKDVHSLLSTFGNIISYEVRPNQDKDRSGFYRLLVTYEATEQAQQAVRNLSNYRYAGSTLRLEYFNPNYGDMNGGPNPHHNK